jgi:LEA14-like dessication related protein
MAGCAKLKEPEFRRIENFGLKKMELEQATIGFSVTYFNPNNSSVNVKEAVADIYLDTVYMGKFVQDKTVDVGKNSEFSIPFSGTIPLQKVLKLGLNDIARRSVQLRADGSVKVGKAGIYVTRPIQYSGHHRLDEIKLRP